MGACLVDLAGDRALLDLTRVLLHQVPSVRLVDAQGSDTG
jgi:hypothetical protein